MKKFRVFLAIVSCLFVFATVAIADVGFSISSIPFSDLAISDLLSIKNMVDDELERREYVDNEILKGVYIGGKDIAVGSYVFYISEEYRSEGDGASVFVYRNWDEYKDKSQLSDVYVHDEVEASVIVEEGTIVSVSSRCACKPSSTNKSWAP